MRATLIVRITSCGKGLYQFSVNQDQTAQKHKVNSLQVTNQFTEHS